MFTVYSSLAGAQAQSLLIRSQLPLATGSTEIGPIFHGLKQPEWSSVSQVPNGKVEALGVFSSLATVEASQTCRDDLMPSCCVAEVHATAPCS